MRPPLAACPASGVLSAQVLGGRPPPNGLPFPRILTSPQHQPSYLLLFPSPISGTAPPSSPSPSWRLCLVLHTAPDPSTPQSKAVATFCQVSLLNISALFIHFHPYGPALPGSGLHPVQPRFLPQPPPCSPSLQSCPSAGVWLKHKPDPDLPFLRTIHGCPESTAESSGSSLASYTPAPLTSSVPGSAHLCQDRPLPSCSFCLAFPPPSLQPSFPLRNIS